ncbi:Pyridine nucleotide-disulphide oxidoreductase [seawater metagenome]|uniref:Pyridine nucleotide-disulphide oxidoreductase n=1 Tax=seawater metagenome TaxID=1561972 RepID=A0A5E8CL01_9ZZZZ
MEQYDVCIIGAGPAGCTAALYSSRAELNTLVIEGIYSKDIMPGGQLVTTTDVENYPGFKVGINGAELVENMKSQAQRFNAQFLNKNIVRVDFTDSNNLKLFTHDNKEINSKTVIIATGAKAKKLEFPGCETFWNKGISACAVCDGALPLFRKKPLAVIGGGDSAMEEALFLTKYASKVYIIHRRDELRASKIMQKRAIENEKIEFLYSHQVIEAMGEKLLKKIKVKCNKTDKIAEIDCNGLFFGIGHEPMSKLFSEYVDTFENGYIKTDGESTKTNINGVFACGDVKDFKWRQAITAAGSGCIASLEAEEYLANL